MDHAKPNQRKQRNPTAFLHPLQPNSSGAKWAYFHYFVGCNYFFCFVFVLILLLHYCCFCYFSLCYCCWFFFWVLVNTSCRLLFNLKIGCRIIYRTINIFCSYFCFGREHFRVDNNAKKLLQKRIQLDLKYSNCNLDKWNFWNLKYFNWMNNL